ncbi:hypothetical protein MLD38_027651 [Melastoma candidum]|uniref:Uncharacterized protein n=1 Tax=Melastoma candidum TaxID=119954 RepID=A0ACB9P3Q3_9MYRT|nr:hypothetical protein MLD38_027651 [Melastoma candidum]
MFIFRKIAPLSCKTFFYSKSNLCTLSVSSDEFAAILRTCSDPRDLPTGRQLHARCVVSGIIRTDHFLGTKILGMYVLCGGGITDSSNVFYGHGMSQLVSSSEPWNWMIRGLANVGLYDFVFLFYLKMLGFGILPHKYTFPSVVKALGGVSDRGARCKVMDELVELMGERVDMFVGSSLIKFYVENGRLIEAQRLFERMPQKDCVLWNVMMNGCLKNGDWRDVIKLFLEMWRTPVRPNNATFAGILSVCAPEGLVDLGAQLHGLSVICGLEMDPTVANTLLAMYSKCKSLDDARRLFDSMPQPDVVSWNAIISGYAQNGIMEEARYWFREMVSAGAKPDAVTFSSLLPSITDSVSLKQVKLLHGYILRNGVPCDVFLKSALIDAYFKCRSAKLAIKMFELTSDADIVIYTAMISGSVLNGLNHDAVTLFKKLLEQKLVPTSVTIASLLPAFAGLASLRLGKELHGYILRQGLDHICFVQSSVADMYAKCGWMDVALNIFANMPDKDVVCWNSMITNCSQNGKPEEAIGFFREMGLNGIMYDRVSISSVLSACASLPALHHGREIHGYMVKCSYCHDIYAESALIDMYAKCGCLDLARRVFDMLREKNDVSWNSIIAAYGSHGALNECLSLFDKMIDNSMRPDSVTFLAIISACGHAGEIDKGINFFYSMTNEYGIPCKMEHYACVADLFGRAGRVKEAFEMIKIMPFPPDAGIWGTLLGACRLHGHVELASIASQHLIQMEPENSGYYMLLSNLHADVGQWKGVLNVRRLMKERAIKKVPGISWIEVDRTPHMFVAADGNHPKSKQIYVVLELLIEELRKEGYIPQPKISSRPLIEGLCMSGRSDPLLCA